MVNLRGCGVRSMGKISEVSVYGNAFVDLDGDHVGSLYENIND